MGRATRKPRSSRAAGSPKAHRPTPQAPAARVPATPAGTPPAAQLPPDPASAEAVLVLHYTRLARLAYTVLPSSLDRHRRVLAAHALVQRALPNRLPDLLRTRQPGVPAPRRSSEGTSAPIDPAYAHLRATVLSAALREAPQRPGLLPQVWGLRLFPASSGTEGLALERELAGLSPAERAAYALLTLEELSPASAGELLRVAGVEDPDGALRRAEALGAAHSAQALLAPDFDPCTVHARPTDLLRRRRRLRGTAAAAVLAVAAVVTATLTLPGGGGPTAAPLPTVRPGSEVARAVAAVVRVPDDTWRHTARIDFTAWPARGDQLHDQALIARALTLWSSAGQLQARRGLVHAEPGTTSAPPAQSPRLLWAGRVDGASVVLLDDGSRLARYTRPDRPTGSDVEQLDLSRSDESDVTTAGAVLLRSTAAGDRFLIAPWVDTVQLRDLRAPNTAARDLSPVDGLTPDVAAPPAQGCASWPVLQLRSSSVIAEHHAFLLTDLGGITAAHLTFTPPPQSGPANYPREATGSAALVDWGRLGCSLPALRGQDVKSVNAWEFADQQLPENQGTAAWTCTRADRWDGTGSAATQFLPPTNDPAATATTTGTQPQGRACSRYEQYVVADTWWRSAAGRSYLLAAGSRHVVSMATQGGLSTPASAVPSRTMALPVPARPQAAVTVTGALDTGQTARSLG
ncbi:hypothetical protein ABUW04_01505 [Streptacidiphilus sp. N1-10]|uniref:DNA-directed RNA polymerase specialized sigma24 family protein n=1 Tax=Streptacidiphilus jeojiensis TaxID=3229225 RepID=A0ABV6XFD9_9ACTN